MADKFVVDCPAKINLYLRIGEPDSRGYHPLETEFQAISLFDTLEVSVGGSGFEVEGMELPPSNTVTRALRLMQEVATLPPIGLRLVKRIPSQAGLGGGSSDAAGLLRVLRRLLPSIVPDRDFLSVARNVGADVPFFLVGGRALGAGYGDLVESLPDLEERWLVMAKPDMACSTPEMYGRLDAFRASGGVFDGSGWAENDFHAVAPPECMALMSSMRELGLGPGGLCGSGSAVFGFAPSQADAERCAAKIDGAVAARTLGRAESLKLGASVASLEV